VFWKSFHCCRWTVGITDIWWRTTIGVQLELKLIISYLLPEPGYSPTHALASGSVGGVSFSTAEMIDCLTLQRQDLWGDSNERPYWGKSGQLRWGRTPIESPCMAMHMCINF
jgi:hypothetical protein